MFIACYSVPVVPTRICLLAIGARNGWDKHFCSLSVNFLENWAGKKASSAGSQLSRFRQKSPATHVAQVCSRGGKNRPCVRCDWSKSNYILHLIKNWYWCWSWCSTLMIAMDVETVTIQVLVESDLKSAHTALSVHGVLVELVTVTFAKTSSSHIAPFRRCIFGLLLTMPKQHGPKWSNIAFNTAPNSPKLAPRWHQRRHKVALLDPKWSQHSSQKPT